MFLKEPIFCRKPVYTLELDHLADPLTIALTGDWHVSDIVTEKQLSFLKSRLTAISPDLIILQGDLFDTPISLNSSRLCLKLKQSLTACAKIAPTVMVLGNHDQVEPVHSAPSSLADYNSRIKKDALTNWRRLCRESGVKLLLNSWFEIGSLRIFGFLQGPEAYYQRPGKKGENFSAMKRSLRELDQAGILTKKPGYVHWFAAHAPINNLYSLPALKSFDVFSFGHTHGGALPLGLDLLADAVHFHGGIIAPFGRWFPSREMRGKETLKTGASLIVNTGMVLAQASAPAYLQNLNFLKAAEVTEIRLTPRIR
ncbi:metallophosphoesterase [Candidatus Saccharibacteria bacterium]|nr:metallophosphoesterase [Candidatus Saccharibacteria bacterium]